MDFPKNIQIETTTICPARCMMCPQRYVSRPKLMDLALIEKIIAECAGKDVTIIPHQMGDALADPRIVDILKKCKDKGLKILLSTSGFLLDKEKAAGLIGIGTDIINISLDSLDKRLYEKIRNVSFDRVMRNIEDLLSMKRPNTAVWVSAVDMFFNKKKREEFIKRWEGRVDNIQIAPYVQYPKIRSWRLPRKKAKNSNRCERLENDMVILSNGDAAKCCIDFEGTTVFGNIKNGTLAQIWDSVERKDFLKNLRANGRSGLYPCNICVI